MTRTAGCRLLIFALNISFAATLVRAAEPASHKTLPHPRPELAAAAQAAIDHGVHAELPPHVSTLLGLSTEQKVPILQGVLRSPVQIQGIDVVEKNHEDIVIFTVDISTQEQTYFLTSPSGILRRVLSVKGGVGNVIRPTKTDLEAFQNEKKMWQDRFAGQPASATTSKK